jgi:hypothetical protein
MASRLKIQGTHYKMSTCPSNRRIAAHIVMGQTNSRGLREGISDKPRGMPSDLPTITMPFLTVDFLTRLSASETHCPASAVVASALPRRQRSTNASSLRDGNQSPFALYAFDHCVLVIPVCIRTEQHGVARLDRSTEHDTVDDGADVRYGPDFCYRILIVGGQWFA